MSTLDKILHQAGDNIRESIGGDGVRELVQAQPAPQESPSGGGRLEGRTRNMQAGTIEIDRLMPDPNQPRQHFSDEELERLGRSLASRGQLQNIRVRWSQDHGKWIIISGERRYQAAKKAGLATLNCEFIERALTEAEILEDQLVENCLREDLDAVELARAYRRLMELMGYNQQQLAAAIHVSDAGVSRTLAVLDLPEDLLPAVQAGSLAATTAYEISRLPSADAQREAAKQVTEQNLNHQQAVELVQQQLGRRNHAASKTGKRFSCKLPEGDSVTVTAAESMTIDRLIDILEALLKQARRTRQKELPLAELSAILKAKRQQQEPDPEPKLL